RRFWRISVASAQSGTLYRGREGMWSWVAHRISGMLIFLFLLVHVLDTALVRVSPEAYNQVIGHYNTVVFGLGEVGLVGAVLLHPLIGVRVILVDFWSQAPSASAPCSGASCSCGSSSWPASSPATSCTCSERDHDVHHLHPRSEHPLPPHGPARHQLRDALVAVHARLRPAAGDPRLRPPLREPVAGRGRQGHRLRL